MAAPLPNEGDHLLARRLPVLPALPVAVRRPAGRATWVDIRADPETTAYVRTTNEGGFETVPTVVMDGVAHTNPPPALVTEALARR